MNKKLPRIPYTHFTFCNYVRGSAVSGGFQIYSLYFRVPQVTSVENTNKPNVPAVPRSQAVKRFVEPSYSTLLQLQNDLGTARQKKLGQQQQQLQQQPHIRESKNKDE